jgi:Tol biopolymer transport system component
MVYAQTPGVGYGSELWTADPDGKNGRLLLAEPESILALPRWSPDGKQLAYIRMPDTQTPFPNGELWLLDITSGERRFLSEADAGHGYAPAWSPDGDSIAFVVRENPEDPLATQAAGNMRSNLYVLEVETGIRSEMTRLENAQTGTPAWSADGRSIVFAAWLDGKMNLWAHDMTIDETIPLTEAGACCPVWIGK